MSCQRSLEPVYLRWKSMEKGEGVYVRSAPGTIRLTQDDRLARRVMTRTRVARGHPAASSRYRAQAVSHRWNPESAGGTIRLLKLSIRYRKFPLELSNHSLSRHRRPSAPPAYRPRRSLETTMSSPKPSGRDSHLPKVIGTSKRKTIPASKVGVTLAVSDEARKEIERMREKAIKAAQQDREFSWR